MGIKQQLVAVKYLHEARMCEDMNPHVVNVDSGNLGGAFIDMLGRMTGHTIMGVDFGAAGKNDRKYFNRRAEMYDHLREWLSNGGRLPSNTKLANELLSIELNDRREGRLTLQPKHKLARSPDLADACALTMCRDVPICSHSHLKIEPHFK